MNELIIVLIILLLFILYKVYYNNLTITDIENLQKIFDTYIEHYSQAFANLKISLDIVAGNTSVEQKEFIEIREEMVRYIWDNIPKILKIKLLKHFGINHCISYITIKIDPVLDLVYKTVGKS